MAEWQQNTGRKVNLKLVSDDFIEQSLLEAWKNPYNVNTPDIVFSITFNQIIAPILAWEDKLLDLSDLLNPIASTSRFIRFGFVYVCKRLRHYCRL
ncbi:hypothetical protein [Nostoc sp. CENA543]|uniref:hypothetical protein n=1 Tax=Nostoc sp. CENA543 TaxID=1869241 RepID=UPI001CEF6C66|nr:hypothetical protein [Nostoc sp. CENA543]